MLFSDGACSRRVSLFKAVLFSAKKYKAQERGERRSWELGESGRILSSSSLVFCVWNAAGGRKEEAKKTRLSWNEEKERILMKFFQFFQFFFSTKQQTSLI